MTDSLKDRRLFYRRAIWRDHGNYSFQDFARYIHQKLPMTSARTFDYHDGKIQGLSWRDERDFIFFHVGQFSPGDRASVIPTSLSRPIADPDEHPAPDGTDYLSGDIMALCKDNHVIVCPSHAREAVLGAYLEQSFEAIEGRSLAAVLDLSPVADVNAVRLIQREGVKKVRLSSSLYKASLDYEKDLEEKSIIERATDGIMALISKDEDLAEISAKENISIHLEIRLDQRIKRGREISTAQIGEVATSVLQDDESFSIETQGGNRVTGDSIRVSDKVKLETLGSSVRPEDAFEKMLDYYEHLMDSGILEQ